MIESYINLIVGEMQKDVKFLDYDYGWNFILFPYIYWFIYYLLKYLILTLPVWAPLRLIFLNFINYNSNKK